MTKKPTKKSSCPEVVLKVAGEKIPVFWEKIPDDGSDQFTYAYYQENDDGTHKIVMDIGVNKTKEWEYFLHEVFHMICNTYRVRFLVEDDENQQREESLCDIFSKGYTQALKFWLPKRIRKGQKVQKSSLPSDIIGILHNSVHTDPGNLIGSTRIVKPKNKN